jgi:hypothetical protein
MASSPAAPFHRFTLPSSPAILHWRVRSYCCYTLAFPLSVCATSCALWGRPSRLGAAALLSSLLLLNFLAHRLVSLLVLPACAPSAPWVPALAARLRQLAGAAAAPLLEGLERHLTASRAAVARGTEALEASPLWQSVALTAPDGAQTRGWLKGWYGGRAPARGVVLYLGGNGEHAALSALPAADAWEALGYGVMVSDYRGVSSAAAAATRDGLVLDALTALSFLLAPSAQGGLALPPHRVLVVGHSLGGGVGVEAVALCATPGVTVLSDRSFGRLTDAAVCLLFPPSLLPPPAAGGGGGGAGRRLGGGAAAAPAPPAPAPDDSGLQGYAARTVFRAVMRWCVGWEYDSAALWPLLPAHTKVLVYAPNDGVIKFPASLAAAVTGGGGGAALPSEAVGCLCKMDVLGPAEDGKYAHNRPFNASERDRLRRVCELAGEALGAGNVLGTGARVAGARRALPVSW